MPAFEPRLTENPVHPLYCQISSDFLFQHSLLDGTGLRSRLIARIDSEYGTAQTVRWGRLADRIMDTVGNAHLGIVFEGEVNHQRLVRVLRGSIKARVCLIPVPLAAMLVLALFGSFDALTKFPTKAALAVTRPETPRKPQRRAYQSFNLLEALEKHDYVVQKTA